MNLFAPKEQQDEGLRFILSTVPFPVFLQSLRKLIEAGMLSKAKQAGLIKRARHILGVSYQTYVSKYK